MSFVFSAVWDLDVYCQEKQSEYQKKGIQGRWQVSPEELEPPNKKLKVEEINLDGVIKMKVPIQIYCFLTMIIMHITN